MHNAQHRRMQRQAWRPPGDLLCGVQQIAQDRKARLCEVNPYLMGASALQPGLDQTAATIDHRQSLDVRDRAAAWMVFGGTRLPDLPRAPQAIAPISHQVCVVGDRTRGRMPRNEGEVAALDRVQLQLFLEHQLRSLGAGHHQQPRRGLVDSMHGKGRPPRDSLHQTKHRAVTIGPAAGRYRQQSRRFPDHDDLIISVHHSQVAPRAKTRRIESNLDGLGIHLAAAVGGGNPVQKHFAPLEGTSTRAPGEAPIGKNGRKTWHDQPANRRSPPRSLLRCSGSPTTSHAHPTLPERQPHSFAHAPLDSTASLRTSYLFLLRPPYASCCRIWLQPSAPGTATRWP